MSKTNKKDPNVQPLGDRVLLKAEDRSEESRTASGIIIPKSADSDHETKKATVIAVGKGRFVDGQYLEPEVKKGDRVLYNWGDEISVDGEKYIIASVDNITAIIG